LPAVAAARHDMLVADAFVTLRELQRAGKQYGLIVIDPPSMANSAAEVPRALSAYERLVVDALPLLRPGGILVMASCTARVPAEHFFHTVHRTAQQHGRPLHEIIRTGQPIDHPVSFKEGAYLKCLFATAP